ncbi:MAG: hypothetical protein AAGA48_13770 [Myxococcota bacterium]
MRDEEEAMCDAITAAPNHLIPLRIYADWLLDRGDPRADYLIGALRVLEADPFDPAVPALKASRDAAAASIDPTWLVRMHNPRTVYRPRFQHLPKDRRTRWKRLDGLGWFNASGPSEPWTGDAPDFARALREALVESTWAADFWFGRMRLYEGRDLIMLIARYRGGGEAWVAARNRAALEQIPKSLRRAWNFAERQVGEHALDTGLAP